MAGVLDNRKTGTRILLGAVVLLLGGSMLLYLVPQTPGTGEASTDTVAKIGDQSVSLQEVRDKVNEIERQRQIPKSSNPAWLWKYSSNLYSKELEYEAKRLGITVSDQERADRIRQFLAYRFQWRHFRGHGPLCRGSASAVPITRRGVRRVTPSGLLEEKFRKLVTDGISVGPAELQDEFRNKNEKVKLEYALISPKNWKRKSLRAKPRSRPPSRRTNRNIRCRKSAWCVMPSWM